MRINSDKIQNLPLGELCEKIKKLKSPAVLLDNELKVVYKNRFATSLLRDLRKGRSMGEYLPKSVAFTVSEMKPNEVISVELRIGAQILGATVVCTAENRLVMIYPMAINVFKSLENIYRKSSGYDISLPDSEPPIADLVNQSLNKLSYTHVPSFFSAKVLVKGVADCFCSLTDARVVTEESGCELISLGSEKDFALVVAYILSICNEQSSDKKIKVKMLESNGVIRLRFSVSTAKSVSPNPSAEAEENTDYKSNYENNFNGRLVLIKLISDGNVWDFDLKKRDNGKLSFELCAPLAEERESFALRDVSTEEIQKIVTAILGK